MKRKNISLDYALVPRGNAAGVRGRAAGAGVSSAPGDISGYDGRYGFSCNWEWDFEVEAPENWDGKALTVELTVTADDSATLSLGGLSVSASYDKEKHRAGTGETSGELMPGIYRASLSFSNIDYDPPEENAAVLGFGITVNGKTVPVDPKTIIPIENLPEPKDDSDCACGDENNDAGGEAPAAARSRAQSFSDEAAGTASSAGRDTRLETNENFARWQTSFGKFRGLGGIPAGTLEIFSHEFSEKLATPEALEFSHPLNSWLALPAEGITANAQFKVFTGGGYSSWFCDGERKNFFAVGTSSKTARELRWASPEKTALELLFPDKSSVTYSAATGEIVAFKTKNGNVFSAEELAAYVDVVRDESGCVRQIWNLWDGLANVENITGSGYDIALYPPAQVGAKDAGTGLRAVSGTPFKRFSVALSSDGKLSVSERDSRAGAPVFPVKFWFENGAWNESAGTGAEEIFTLRAGEKLSENTWRLTTTRKRGASGAPASCVAETFRTDPALGKLCISRTEGFGTDFARTTTFEHDDCGRTVKETRADGSVVETTYDAHGRISARYEPHAAARNRTTYFDYVSADDNSAELSRTKTVLSREKNGPLVLSQTNYVYSENAEFRRTEKRTTALGAKDVRTEIEEIRRGNCENVFARGRVKMRQTATGAQTHYEYAGTTLHGALYVETQETRVAGVPVNEKSTRLARYISADGNVLFEEKFVLDSAGTWRSVASAEIEYDAQNRETKRTRGNGRVSTRESMCCGTLWEIDEDGVRTDFSYDSAKTLSEKMRAETPTVPEKITVYERDANGAITRETLKLDGPTFSEKTFARDILGRTVSETDELGRTTTHAFSADGLTETTTLPSGATLIVRRHADGTILARAGTGQRATETLVDTVADGVRKTTRIAGTSGDGGILSREIENGFGETLRRAVPNTLGGLVFSHFDYDARGFSVREVSGNSAPTLREYDAFGNETKRTFALAETPTPANSRITENAFAFEAREDGIYRVATTTTYSAAGTPLVQSSAELVSENEIFERKTIATDARGNVSVQTTRFGTGSERIAETQIPAATNLAETRSIDGFTVAQKDHAGTQKTFSRQFFSGTHPKIVLTETDGRGNTTTTEQNVLGQTTKTTDAAGNTTLIEYDLPSGKPACITDALGKTQRRAYDIRGNLVAEFGTGTRPAVFAYDDAGNKISQKLFRAGTEEISDDPRERTDFDETRWEYHAATGLVLTKIHPDESRVNYAYGGENRLTQTIFSREISAGTPLKITRTYNGKTGELLSVSYNDGTPGETYAYNFLGQQTRVEIAGVTTTVYAYDDFGAVISETTGGLFSKTLTRHYDAFGRNVGYSVDGVRKTTLSYDPASGRINSAHAGTGNFSWEYHAGTALKSKLIYPNGATAEWVYESKRDLLSCVKNTVNGAVSSQYDYANDALGRRVSCARSGTMFAAENDAVSYGYNARSELTGAVSAGDENFAFSYAFDNCGNRNSATEKTAETLYATNTLNQYTQVADFSPSYDADGNVTQIATETGTWTVSWNGANRPVTWTKSTGEKIFMMYDHLGRRVEKRVLNAAGTRTLRERYVYDGFLCVQVLNGDGGNAVVKEFVWDPTEPVATRPLAFVYTGAGVNLFYNFDGNKNVSEVFYLALQNKIGAHYEYAPFGKIYKATKNTHVGVDVINQNPFRFSSEFFDPEFGLIYYNYRHYSPSLGRFLSRDPIEEQGGLNLYAFCRNNPSSIRDILGQNCFWEDTVDQLSCAISDVGEKISCAAGYVWDGVSCVANTVWDGVTYGATKIVDGVLYVWDGVKWLVKEVLLGYCGPNGEGGPVATITLFIIPDRPFFLADLSGCCKEHDKCYGILCESKDNCDNKFRDCIKQEIEKSIGVFDLGGYPSGFISEGYYLGVHKGADSAYELAQKEAREKCLNGRECKK